MSISYLVEKMKLCLFGYFEEEGIAIYQTDGYSNSDFDCTIAKYSRNI